ncbi:MAG: LPS export ABC transporter periplasmic protein LptC [Arsenophonus sp. ET-DL9-MAG3]
MKKVKFYINIILILIVLVLIGINLANFNQSKTLAIIDVNDNQPNFKIGKAITHIYTPTGKLIYKLIMDEMHRFSKNKTSLFINPILMTYETEDVPTWVIRANKAKLMNDNMLYLYGNVQVNSLNSSSNLRQILTENAIINLITKDVSSNSKVTIIGIGLRSVGMKMYGNMKTYTAELIKDVKTYYEVKNNQAPPKKNH